MGKIQITRPIPVNNAPANALLNAGLEGLKTAWDPIKGAVQKATDDNTKQLTGAAMQFVQANSPDDPDFQRGLQAIRDKAGFGQVDETALALAIKARQDQVKAFETQDINNKLTTSKTTAQDLANALEQQFGAADRAANLASTQAKTALTNAQTQGVGIANQIQAATGMQAAQASINASNASANASMASANKTNSATYWDNLNRSQDMQAKAWGVAIAQGANPSSAPAAVQQAAMQHANQLKAAVGAFNGGPSYTIDKRGNVKYDKSAPASSSALMPPAALSMFKPEDIATMSGITPQMVNAGPIQVSSLNQGAQQILLSNGYTPQQAVDPAALNLIGSVVQNEAVRSITGAGGPVAPNQAALTLLQGQQVSPQAVASQMVGDAPSKKTYSPGAFSQAALLSGKNGHLYGQILPANKQVAPAAPSQGDVAGLTQRLRSGNASQADIQQAQALLGGNTPGGSQQAPAAPGAPSRRTEGGRTIVSNMSSTPVSMRAYSPEEERAILGSRVKKAGFIYERLRAHGFSDMDAKVMVGQINRENAFANKYLFGTHSDPYNKAINGGMMSWQGSRGKNLKRFMAEHGYLRNGKMPQSLGALNAQIAFMVSEIQGNKRYASSFGSGDEETAWRLTSDRFIGWRRTDPKYASAGRKAYNEGRRLLDQYLGTSSGKWDSEGTGYQGGQDFGDVEGGSRIPGEYVLRNNGVSARARAQAQAAYKRQAWEDYVSKAFAPPPGSANGFDPYASIRESFLKAGSNTLEEQKAINANTSTVMPANTPTAPVETNDVNAANQQLAAQFMTSTINEGLAEEAPAQQEQRHPYAFIPDQPVSRESADIQVNAPMMASPQQQIAINEAASQISGTNTSNTSSAQSEVSSLGSNSIQTNRLVSEAANNAAQEALRDVSVRQEGDSSSQDLTSSQKSLQSFLDKQNMSLSPGWTIEQVADLSDRADAYFGKGTSTKYIQQAAANGIPPDQAMAFLNRAENTHKAAIAAYNQQAAQGKKPYVFNGNAHLSPQKFLEKYVGTTPQEAAVAAYIRGDKKNMYNQLSSMGQQYANQMLRASANGAISTAGQKALFAVDKEAIQIQREQAAAIQADAMSQKELHRFFVNMRDGAEPQQLFPVNSKGEHQEVTGFTPAWEYLGSLEYQDNVINNIATVFGRDTTEEAALGRIQQKLDEQGIRLDEKKGILSKTDFQQIIIDMVDVLQSQDGDRIGWIYDDDPEPKEWNEALDTALDRFVNRKFAGWHKERERLRDKYELAVINEQLGTNKK